MNALFEAAKEVCDFMKKRRWKFCVIGGLAVQRWGELRTTLDADLTLFTGFGEEEKYVDALLGHFPARTTESRNLALLRRVLLIRATNGKDVDIALGCFPFEKAMIRRATPFEFASGVVLPTCSADDLFVMKVFAARGKDLHDAETIAIRQNLDRNYILRRLNPNIARVFVQCSLSPKRALPAGERREVLEITQLVISKTNVVNPVWPRCKIGAITALCVNFAPVWRKIQVKPLCELKETPELVEQARRILEKHP